MSDTIKFPFYIKLTAILLCLIAIFVILYFGQAIISPILLSLLFAIMLRPVVSFLIKKLRFPHFIASVFTIVLFGMLFFSVIYFISVKIADMASDWENIKNNFLFHIEHFQQLIDVNFHISKNEQKQLITEATKSNLDSGKQIIGNTLVTFADMILNITVIPLYTFLFLFYQNLFITFLAKLVTNENHQLLREVLSEIKTTVQSYIVGLLFEMIAVSTLTAIGYYFIGVEYFILLGIITGILNLVPYLGILFAGVLSSIVSLSGSTDLSIVLGVFTVNVIVQVIDNNVLVPLFVNSKVRINAFVSIIGIIIGNILGGLIGMFLAIPMIAIIKVIFDRIDSLEPWGYLFGDELPKKTEWNKENLQTYNYSNVTSTDEILNNSEQPNPIDAVEPNSESNSTESK
jgi:predicted PurR-regulated permease PerM